MIFTSQVVPAEQMTNLGCHLGLDTEFMGELRKQVNDVEEFRLLVNYLGIDPSHDNLFKMPSTLVQGPILSKTVLDSMKKNMGLD